MRPLDRLSSIRAKLGFVIVFAVGVTILIMYVTVGFALRRAEHDRQFREAFGSAQQVAAVAFSRAGTPSRSLRRVVGLVHDRVAVVDASDRVLIGDFRPPPTVTSVLSGSAVDTGKAGDEEYVGVPVTRSGRIVGAVYLAYRVESSGLAGAIAGTARFVRSVWWQFLLAGAVSAFIALFLARLLARGMTQPLRDMAHAAARMARGNYDQRVEVRSRDEVGRLAESFNRMAGDMAGLERLRRELVANVSHELKTPISAIRAHVENLLDGVEQPNPEVLAVMLAQSERLSKLVDELLDLSRLESGDVPLDIAAVALRPLVDEVGTEVSLSRPGHQVEVRNDVPADLPTVEADRIRLHQVLFNLLDNAVRFSPSGGVVTVRADARDGWCEVSVADEGPGIPAEHLPLVFERFYRVDQSRSRGDGGTGIGLAIARSIVHAHGGTIWADSVEGKGSVFRFRLPVRADQATGGDSITAAGERVPAGSVPAAGR